MSLDSYIQQVFKQAGCADNGDGRSLGCDSFPIPEDAFLTLSRVYPTQAPTGLNSARPLEHLLVVHCIIQNYGSKIKGHIAFPSSEELFDIVWKLIPAYIQQEIKELASVEFAEDKNSRAIALQLSSFVKVALGMLDVPVPGMFIDAIVNLVIPPLVVYIVKNLPWNKQQVSNGRAGEKAIRIGLVASPETRQILYKLHRKILLGAGVPILHLPAHLKSTRDNEDGDDGTTEYPSFGWPSERDSMGALEDFYDGCPLNGSLRMPLTQTIMAQIISDDSSDEETVKFAPKVWDTLTSDLKKTFRKYAEEKPPNEHDLSEGLYKPVYDKLSEEPYNVPPPIRPAFASMKVPEVVAWVIHTYGSDE